MSDVSIYKYATAQQPILSEPQYSQYSGDTTEVFDMRPEQVFESPEKQFKYSRYEQLKARKNSLTQSEHREYEQLDREFRVEDTQPNLPEPQSQSRKKSLVIDYEKFVGDSRYQEQVYSVLNLEKIKREEQKLSNKLNSEEYVGLLEKYLEFIEQQAEIPQKDRQKIKRILQQKRELKELQSQINQIEHNLETSEVKWIDGEVKPNQLIVGESKYKNIPIRPAYTGSSSESRHSFSNKRKD